jgi:hypothetical protein
MIPTPDGEAGPAGPADSLHRPARWTWGLVALGFGVALSRWLVRARYPDGFDSIDFLLGMSKKLDLAALQPHFPGYPVYVALGAALCRLGVPALDAATTVSALAAGFAAVALAICARGLTSSNDAGLAVAGLHTVAWLPWLVGSAALSDSLGLALAAVSAAALVARRPGASGFAGGLLLGVRLSYWPIAGVLLGCAALRPRNRRAPMGFALGSALWAVPFFAIVGVRSFIDLGITHLKGHFGAWGGSVVTQPLWLERFRALGRGVFFDGLVPSLWALAAVVVLIALAWRSARAPWKPVALALAPYAAWAFLAQNVVEQPRHLLPLVEGGLLLLGCFLARRRWLLLAVCAVCAWVNVPLLWERARTPPAAGQAAAWLANAAPAADTAVMAGRSWRFFAEPPGPLTVRRHTWLSEVIVDLSRFDRLPPYVFLTSEVDLHSGGGESAPRPRSWRVEPGPRFCRDSRIDRSDTCLGLSRLVWSP